MVDLKEATPVPEYIDKENNVVSTGTELLAYSPGRHAVFDALQQLDAMLYYNKNVPAAGLEPEKPPRTSTNSLKLPAR